MKSSAEDTTAQCSGPDLQCSEAVDSREVGSMSWAPWLKQYSNITFLIDVNLLTFRHNDLI